jgi:hypothetical protein
VQVAVRGGPAGGRRRDAEEREAIAQDDGTEHHVTRFDTTTGGGSGGIGAAKHLGRSPGLRRRWELAERRERDAAYPR